MNPDVLKTILHDIFELYNERDATYYTFKVGEYDGEMPIPVQVTKVDDYDNPVAVYEFELDAI